MTDIHLEHIEKAIDGFDHAIRTMLELKKTKCKNIGFAIVISPDNIKDLVSLYDLSSYLDIELCNSVMHNSWYFHKYDNAIVDGAKALSVQNDYIKALLCSKRRGFKNKLKEK